MANEKDTALILDYLAGKLAGEARVQLEARLAAEPDLAEELAVQRGLNLVLKAGRRRDLEARMRKVSAQVADEAPMEAQVRRVNWRGVGIAAAVLLLAVVGVFIYRGGGPMTPEALYAENFAPYTQGGPVRGTDPESAYEQAWEAYLGGEYAAAIPFFASVPPRDTIYPQVRVFLGVSHLGAGQPESARAVLGPIAGDPEAAYREVAAWYVGLSYLQEGQAKAAVDHFQQGEAAGFRYNWDRVRQLLQKMEKM
ncbi:MAG: hypothetical protein AAGN35_22915 [Bacteroidota bacterium]